MFRGGTADVFEGNNENALVGFSCSPTGARAGCWRSHHPARPTQETPTMNDTMKAISEWLTEKRIEHCYFPGGIPGGERQRLELQPQGKTHRVFFEVVGSDVEVRHFHTSSRTCYNESKFLDSANPRFFDDLEAVLKSLGVKWVKL